MRARLFYLMEKGLGLTLDDLPIQNITPASPVKQLNMEETVKLPSAGYKMPLFWVFQQDNDP